MKWCACSWQNHLQSTTHSYGISESRMSNQNLPQVLVGTATKEIACTKWCVLFRNQSLHSSSSRVTYVSAILTIEHILLLSINFWANSHLVSIQPAGNHKLHYIGQSPVPVHAVGVVGIACLFASLRGSPGTMQTEVPAEP